MSDTDSDWDTPDVASITGPGASKGELLEALKTLKIDVQKLHEENWALKEENRVLLAEKPKCKRKVNAEPPGEPVAHEMAIVINARKYGMMTEMFPSKDLLNKLLPSSLTPFDSTNRYKTALTQESAFLDELYHGFPEWVHIIMESSYFADLVLKSIMDTRLSEIKKLQNIAGIIFKLPSKYFPGISYDHALYKQELNICLEKLE
ncbi:hypothetical protein BD769DRAFT_1664463 [Suillus cothurnatus]|nr:hypothetical protein BD769DRAFT_1664463 [Suillus cothurnatus]